MDRITVSELTNTWGCKWWMDGDDTSHYGFGDCPVSQRAKLWLGYASGDAVRLLLDADLATIIRVRQGAYGGEKRTVVVNIAKLEAACDRYWDWLNAAGQWQDEAGCHYCGQATTRTGFFGEPVCSGC